jgi:alkylation response protein AidB-like acyl-CoA dehydrogenase
VSAIATKSAERSELVRMVREFALREVRPLAEELDATERFPSQIYEQMGSLGLFGISVPEHAGGGGGSTADYVAVMEELSYGYASVADQCGVVELVASLLSSYGTPEQLERWMPGLLSGRQRCSDALTEANAGSDLGGVKTRATAAGSGWVLNGEKIYIHNAPVADVALVLAVTDPDGGRRHGMSIFLVDTRLLGVTKAYVEHKMGQRASPVGGFVFEDAHLPADALLGEVGKGFGAVMSVLEKGRLGIGALANGISRAALDVAREHAATRHQFGQSLDHFQTIAFRLADMAVDYRSAHLMVDWAADVLDQGLAAGACCSSAKLYASEACLRNVDRAVQVHGGSGFIRGVVAERLYRDARITAIYEGTSEIQRLIISRDIDSVAGGISR